MLRRIITNKTRLHLAIKDVVKEDLMDKYYSLCADSDWDLNAASVSQKGFFVYVINIHKSLLRKYYNFPVSDKIFDDIIEECIGYVKGDYCLPEEE